MKRLLSLFVAFVMSFSINCSSAFWYGTVSSCSSWTEFMVEAAGIGISKGALLSRSFSGVDTCAECVKLSRSKTSWSVFWNYQIIKKKNYHLGILRLKLRNEFRNVSPLKCWTACQVIKNALSMYVIPNINKISICYFTKKGQKKIIFRNFFGFMYLIRRAITLLQLC